MSPLHQIKTLVRAHPAFRKLLLIWLISGAGSALVPIAFAIETIRIEPGGWSMAAVLISLWGGRFLGMLAYKKAGYQYSPVLTMMCAAAVMGLAQLALFLWFVVLSKSLAAMLVSAFIYGIAFAVFGPSQFVTIPLITTEENRVQANSLLSMIGDSYGTIGPIFGATLVIFLGFNDVLAIDALTFFVAALLLMNLSSDCRSLAQNTDNGCAANAGNSIFTVGSIFEFPLWVRCGMLSWFFISVAIGFMGAAGPTLVISNYSELNWALVATTMALGSLTGALSLLSGALKNISWSHIHLVCGLALTCQLIVLGLAFGVWLLAMAAFIGAASVTASGIRWDTIGQSQFTDRHLHTFASFDQFAGTLGVPTGMILFGLAGLAGLVVEMTVMVGSLVLVFTAPVIIGGRRDRVGHP